VKRTAKCLNCDGDIPPSLVVKGIRRNLCSRKFCLTCSPWGRHNTRQIHKKENRRRVRRECNICGEGFIYDKTKRKGHSWSRCNSCVVRERHRSYKQRLVVLHGGKCIRCGYSKSINALEFHHRRSATKRFTISRCYNRSWESLLKESQKCDLICANCHREEHAKGD
jgi:hypothetical protein